MFRHAYAIFSLIVNNKYVIQLYNTKYEYIIYNMT